MSLRAKGGASPVGIHLQYTAFVGGEGERGGCGRDPLIWSLILSEVLIPKSAPLREKLSWEPARERSNKSLPEHNQTQDLYIGAESALATCSLK